MAIETQKDAELAHVMAREANDKVKLIAAHYGPLKESAFKTHRQICAAEAEFLKPWNDMLNVLRQGLSAYSVEIERKRRAEEERLLAEQRAEANRQAAEARKREEEAREAQRKADASKNAATAAKRQAEADAARQEAESLRAQAAETVLAPVVVETPKAPGSVRKTWDFEITDPNEVPRTYMSIDETRIRKVVLALGADANIPGVRVFQKTQQVFR